MLFQGVRRDAVAAEADESSVKELARRGEVSYRVIAETRPLESATPGCLDKRARPRRRLRLRSAKILDCDNHFLSEAVIHDRSGDGLRIRLARNVVVPTLCAVFDDETGVIERVRVVWRRETEIGLRRVRTLEETEMREAARLALARPYYAVRD